MTEGDRGQFRAGGMLEPSSGEEDRATASTPNCGLTRHPRSGKVPVAGSPSAGRGARQRRAPLGDALACE